MLEMLKVFLVDAADLAAEAASENILMLAQKQHDQFNDKKRQDQATDAVLEHHKTHTTKSSRSTRK